MKISSMRSALYTSARALGDLQAVQKAVEKKSAKPLVDRGRRRILGRFLARLIR